MQSQRNPAHAAGGFEKTAEGALLQLEDILQLQAQVPELTVSTELNRYLVSLSETLRRLAGGEHTVSVRASIALLRASQARALIEGETAVLPDHVQAMFPHVMRHRLMSEDGSDPEEVIAKALDQTPIS